MSAAAGDLLRAVLLGLAGVVVATSVLGLTRAPTTLAAIHYLGPAAVGAPALLAAAVLVSGRQPSFMLQAGLLATFLVAASPFLAQLLGRAARDDEDEGDEIDDDGTRRR